MVIMEIMGLVALGATGSGNYELNASLTVIRARLLLVMKY